MFGRLAFTGGLLFCFLSPAAVVAAPWDKDMYRQQSYEASEIARAPVKGTVPYGYKPFNATPEEADKIKNPVSSSTDSALSGRRLWNTNCLPCHAANGSGDARIGKLVSSPNLLEDFYKQKTDGSIYRTIHVGGANMPAYGFKFSAKEQWDIVNYLRFLQGREVSGLERPE